MFTAFLMVSCSTTDADIEENSGVHEPKLIRFSVGGNMSTRNGSTRDALVKYYDDLTEKEINVTSIIRTTATSYFADEKLKYSTTNDSWGIANKYYWPAGTHFNFFARVPFGDTNISNASYNTFTYTTPSANEGQCDFLYATSYDPSEEENNVPLNFLHGLAAVSFKGLTDGTSVSVVVQNIELCNVYTRGVFTMPNVSTIADSDGNITEGVWSSLSQKGNLNAGVATDGVTLTSLETLDITNTGGEIKVIPQSVSKWVITEGKATEQTKGYLIIHCRLIDNGFYLAGSADTFGKIYVPFEETFDAGKHYTYTLKFGIGYDESGKRNEIHLTMSSTITDWNRETINFDKHVL